MFFWIVVILAAGAFLANGQTVGLVELLVIVGTTRLVFGTISALWPILLVIFLATVG